MAEDFITAVKLLANAKNISEEQIIEAIKSALATAYKKDYGNRNQDIEVEINGNTIESAVVYLVKEVVEEIEDEDIEILYDEIKQVQPDVEVGDEIKIDVTPANYGRIATQAAKQVILQRIQEAEKDALYKAFKDREDSLLNAVVNKVEWSNVFLSIDRNTVILPFRQQIPGESYFPGKRITVYLNEVKQTTRGPQLVISRNHKNIIKKILEREIPEVSSWDVEVVCVARDPGVRSKVCVKAKEESGIDPVGACVGQKGARINMITDELWGEHLDMIEYNEKPEILIARSLQPATIKHVVIINDEETYDEETGKRIKKRAAVFVDEEDRAMAIGKKGQNIRLATDLTQYELDMYNIEELENFIDKLDEINEDNE